MGRKMRRVRVFQAVVLAMALLGAGALAVRTPVSGQSGMTNFTGISASRDVFVGRDLIVDGLTSVSASEQLTVTSGYILTPTHNVHKVRSAALVTLTLGAPDVPAHLMLINSGGQTVRLLDAGNQKLTGVVNVGADDVVQLYFDGTNWFQVAALVAN